LDQSVEVTCSAGDVPGVTSASRTAPATYTAHSCLAGPREAAREFHAALDVPDLAFALFFCSADYDLDALADELGQLFDGTTLIGCTTAGEIGPSGYRDHSISGVGFSATDFSVTTGRFQHLQQFDAADGETLVRDLRQRLEAAQPAASDAKVFAFMLVDGSSVREELVARVLQSELGQIPVVGGSAGDALRFGPTYVYVDGAFRNDAAAVALISTPLPFTIFKTQHFVPDEARAVVTSADVSRRIVREIDGWPAAERFAQLAGVEVDQLDPATFAANPLVFNVNGTDYVRAIKTAHEDGSLTFFGAIDEGIVLRLAKGADVVGDLTQAFARLHDEVGDVSAMVVCDCVLRKLELVDGDLMDRASTLFRENNTVGFCCYGEQYLGVHVNQTMTGVAIGTPSSD